MEKKLFVIKFYWTFMTLILLGIDQSVTNAQNIFNGDFQYSSTCEVGLYCEAYISCVDGWWYFDPYEQGFSDYAWSRWTWCTGIDVPEGSCSTNGDSERGLWMQGLSGLPVNNPRRYATVNPYYGQKSEGLYKLSFSFLSWPSEAGMFVHVSGASTMSSSQGSATFLSTHEVAIPWTGDFECYERTIYLNSDCNVNNPSLEDYPYLVFSLRSGQGPEPPDSEAPGIFGIIDNISICKIFEIELQDDCEKPCINLTYQESCVTQNCTSEQCFFQTFLVFHDEGVALPQSEDILFEYEEPWANQYDCFEIPEEATGVWVSFQTYFEESSSIQSICFNHDFTNCLAYNVETSITWDDQNPPPYEHFTTLTVEAGNTLTISSDVVLSFCENGKLIIEPNARLNLYGKLTSNCSSGWNGVEVYGNGTASQYYLGSYSHGILYCYPQSTIENAYTAVRLYGPDYEDAGGMITADEANFINNRSGIEFAPYTNFLTSTGPERPYSSKIRNSIFDINNDYKLLYPFRQHILLERVFGLHISGNSFRFSKTVEDANNALAYGIGIMSRDARFNIGPSASLISNEPCLPPCIPYRSSEFKGLGIGVLAGTIFINQPFRVYNSDFSNCNFGIVNYRVSGSTILFNSFEMGSPPPVDENHDQVGVSLMGPIYSLEVQENNFYVSDNITDNSLGIVSEYLGDVNQVIRKNYFNEVTIGNEAIGMNANTPTDFPVRGLHYTCNDNLEVTNFDFYIPGTSLYDDDLIREDQMQYLDEGAIAAGNTFSETGDINDGDFGNYGDNHLVYLYYASGSNERPIDYTESSITIDDHNENTCPKEFCLHPCIGPTEFDALVANFYPNLSELRDALDEEEFETAARLRVKHDSIISYILAYIKYDTVNFNRDTLRKWYHRSNSIAGDLYLAGDFMSTGEYSSAINTLDSIPVWHQLTTQQLNDITKVKFIYNTLSTKSIYNLASTDKDSLRLFSEGPGAASAIARSILMVVDTVYLPRYYIPGEINPRSDQTSQESYIKNSNVFPNPTSGLIWFNNRSVKINTRIQFFTSNGILLASKPFCGKESFDMFDICSGISGIYFYRILDDDSIIEYNKILFIP